jgi:hypothetical protein
MSLLLRGVAWRLFYVMGVIVILWLVVGWATR